jgi:hypothetical protein
MANSTTPSYTALATLDHKAKTHRGWHAASTSLSLALTPVLPFMAVPAGISAYKTYKHHKTHKALQPTLQASPQHASAQQVQQFNGDVRRITRHYSRGSLGFVIASALAPVLPHMVVPGALNVYILRRAEKDRRELAQFMQSKGCRVRKRDVARGITRVVIEKAILVPITLGHDDFLLAVPSAVIDPSSSLLTGHESLVTLPGIHEINEAVNAPVEAVQEALGIPTAEERWEDVVNYNVDAGGWHESPEVIVTDILFAGTTAAAVEYVVDRPLEGRDGEIRSGKV